MVSPQTEILCSSKKSNGEPCKNKATPGLEMDGNHLCKAHYANHMLNIKLQELGLMDKEEVSSKSSTPCSQTVKANKKHPEGGPCTKMSSEGCEGMCKLHFRMAQKASSSPKTESSQSPRNKCKSLTKEGKECTNYEAVECEGMCSRHFKSSKKDSKSSTPSTSSLSGLSMEDLLTRTPLHYGKIPEIPAVPIAPSTNAFADIHIPDLDE